MDLNQNWHSKLRSKGQDIRMDEDYAPRTALDRLNLRLNINLKKGIDTDEEEIPHAEAKRILKDIEAKQRSPEQVQKVSEFLLSQIKLRILCHRLGLSNEGGARLLASNSRLIEYEFALANVCKAGDAADAFYIVLSGSVSVHVPFLDHMALATEIMLKAGSTFGEIGIINKEHTRTAHIFTAVNDTQLLYLPADVFLATLGNHFSALFKRRFDFLSQLEAFRHWPKKALKTVSQVIHERFIPLGEGVTLEGTQVDNRDFLQILYKGHIHVEKKVNLGIGGKKETVVLPLLKLKPGSLIFEPRLMEGSLEDLIESCKLDRGENSTTRWSFSTVADTACQIWTVSRHTFFNQLNLQSIVDELYKCHIQVPPSSILAEIYLRQQKWSEYRARTLVDIYSELPETKRKHIKNIVHHNILLQDEERSASIQKIVQNLNAAEYKTRNILDANQQQKSSRKRSSSTSRNSSRARSRSNTSSRRSRFLSRDALAQSRKGEHSRIQVEDMLDTWGLKEDVILKSFRKQKRCPSIDKKYTFTNVLNSTKNMHETKEVRAQSARRRRAQFTEALTIGPMSTQSDRRHLVRKGCSSLILAQEFGQSADTTPCCTEEGVVATKPFVADQFSSLNTLNEGLIRSALLNRLVEGKASPQYRVPSVMGHHKVSTPRAKPSPPSTRVIRQQPKLLRGGGALMKDARQMRKLQSPREQKAFSSGPNMFRNRQVTFRMPARPQRPRG